MFPESLSGKYLLLFHCSLLACINPLLYYILPSVCYHLCWEHCSDNLQDLGLLLFYFMFCWMTSPANPWADYLGSDQRRVFQKSLASGWSCHIKSADIPTLCSDLASCPSLSSALLRGNVTLPALTCCSAAEHRLLRNSALLPYVTTTGADHGLGKSGNVTHKPFHSLLPASPLWMGATSRIGGGCRCPQIILLSLCPKLLWSLLPFPALILTAVISPVSQAVVTYGGAGKSKTISRSPENLRW